MTNDEITLALGHWPTLNATLKKSYAEADLLQLLETELKGRKRTIYAIRIFSRYNRIRGDHERAEILDYTGATAAGKLATFPHLKALIYEARE